MKENGVSAVTLMGRSLSELIVVSDREDMSKPCSNLYKISMEAKGKIFP